MSSGLKTIKIAEDKIAKMVSTCPLTDEEIAKQQAVWLLAEHARTITTLLDAPVVRIEVVRRDDPDSVLWQQWLEQRRRWLSKAL